MYDLKLKMRCVFNYRNVTNSLRKTSSIFLVSKSIISYWNRNFYFIRDECKKRTKKLNVSIEKKILYLVKKNPFITLNEISHKINNIYNIKLSKQTINKFIKKNNISYKRTKIKCFYKKPPKKRDINKFKKMIRSIDKNVICLDETYFYHSMFPHYGRIEKGKKLIKKGYLNKKLYSCIMSIDINGIKKFELCNDNVDSIKLYNFIIKNKYYFKNKSVLLDNVSFHKSKIIKDLANELNINLIYTIPYSPELNPIEESFSKVKHLVRKNYKVSYNIIKKSIISITTNDIIGYYNHSFD